MAPALPGTPGGRAPWCPSAASCKLQKIEQSPRQVRISHPHVLATRVTARKFQITLLGAGSAQAPSAAPPLGCAPPPMPVHAVLSPQSSLHSEAGLGVATLGTLYGGVLLSSLCLPPVLIQSLGCKWTIAVSMCGYVAFSLGNFYASWYGAPPQALSHAASPPAHHCTRVPSLLGWPWPRSQPPVGPPPPPRPWIPVWQGIPGNRRKGIWFGGESQGFSQGWEPQARLCLSPACRE